MKDIYIFGAGGFAREVVYLIRDTKEYCVKAFVDIQDANPIEVDGQIIDVISEKKFRNICITSPTNAAIAIANNTIAKQIISRFKNICTFPNIIHPTTIFYGRMEIGIGNIITLGSFFSEHSCIGSFNRFNIQCGIGHDTIIGSFNQFNSGCKISGAVTIGDENFFGVNSVVLQNVKIGNNNTIGAASLIIHTIKDGNSYIGVPAHKFEY
jgi:sugar O-acyltransferase (sialic acid O-acetyltransferase NeuD family)